MCYQKDFFLSFFLFERTAKRYFPASGNPPPRFFRGSGQPFVIGVMEGVSLQSSPPSNNYRLFMQILLKETLGFAATRFCFALIQGFGVKGMDLLSFRKLHVDEKSFHHRRPGFLCGMPPYHY